ncbi:hypothetical protein B1L04_18815 [Microcystis aeruginosa KW]|uniref:Uncharacterized protein n=1 Tax=Microcystis aeruginosa KW TaxID=1960155 RepID=A0A1V4BTZ9_MICAE|nr:hypothetical protein B1L04_18815 [Microcystis aeruginosa KW]
MSSTSVELDVHALFQNIGTQATKRYFLPRLGRVAYFSRYKVGLRQRNPTLPFPISYLICWVSLCLTQPTSFYFLPYIISFYFLP